MLNGVICDKEKRLPKPVVVEIIVTKTTKNKQGNITSARNLFNGLQILYRLMAPAYVIAIIPIVS